MKAKAKVVAFAVMLVVAVASAGCDGHDSSTSSHPHADGKGPLSATSAPGGASVDAPRPVPYTASFGDFVLCNSVDSSPITIEKITFHYGRPKPQTVDAFVREAKPEDLETGRPPADFAPFISALGTPPNFDEAYAHYPGGGAGTFSQPEGKVITESCETARRAAGEAASNTSFGSSFSNLIVAVTAGERGGVVENFDVMYEIRGTTKILRVDSQLVACGSGITQAHICG